MKITIHRGLNQIGGCITEIQSLSGMKILVDLGHNLPDCGGVSEDKYESPENLDQLLDGCSAVFYTHYHGDHLGFAAEIHERGVAQYMGPLAIQIMTHLNDHMTFAPDLKDRAEANLKALNEFKTFAIGRKTIIGDIAVTPYGVSHSAPDSYMFLIECDGKKVLHTGDFRDHGYLGKGLYTMLEKHIIPQGIDVLITEGTNVGQKSKSVLSEQEISSQFRQIMRKYKNVFILSSSADADRLWSIYCAHNKSRQPFLCDAYQKKMLDIIRDGYDPDKPHYRFVTKKIFDIKDHWTNSKLVEWMHDKGFTMLIRRSGTFQRYLDQVLPRCAPEETCIVYSMFKGYIEPGHKAFNQDLYDFVNQFPNTVFCHTSGHASKECIEKVCSMVNPTTAIIPIHKENSFDFLTLPSEINVKIFNEGALVV